jgi:hypothetical protein
MYISIINQWGNVARKLLKNVKRETICPLDDGVGGKQVIVVNRTISNPICTKLAITSSLPLFH